MAEAIVFMSDKCLCLLLIWEGWEAKIPYNFWAKVRNFGYSQAGDSKGLTEIQNMRAKQRTRRICQKRRQRFLKSNVLKSMNVEYYTDFVDNFLQVVIYLALVANIQHEKWKKNVL